MVRSVAIVGAGNIGIRHLQSLATQGTNSDSRFDIFDISPERENDIREVASPLSQRHTLNFYTDLTQGLEEYDVTIIATTSSIRLKVTNSFLENHKTKNLILEKVVFPIESDFSAFEESHPDLLGNVYVNCNLRSTEFYRNFKKDILSQENIESFKISGNSWGLGCNAIHFLDLLSFLNNDHKTLITNTTINGVIEAKRSGYDEVLGKIVGTCGSTQFTMNCSEGDFSLLIEINTDKNTYKFNDTGSGYQIETSNESFSCENTRLPYQSEMTNSVVEDLVNSNSCNLPKYETSRDLHLEMLKSFSNQEGVKCIVT
jgi:hypothetical protein